MRECMKEVEYLIKSKIQCIWINSYEEEEVILDLKEIVKRNSSLKIQVWSHTAGLKRLTLNKNEKPFEAVRMPVEKIFKEIEKYQNADIRDECVWILRDLHLYKDLHQVKRSIRDLKEIKSKNYNPIIVIAPIVDIPMEHQKLFTVVDYELPDKDYITKYVNTFCDQILEKKKNLGQKIIVPNEQERISIINSCMGLTRRELEDAIAKSLVKHKAIDSKEIQQEKIQIIRKSGVLDYKIPKIKFEDIGGNKRFKNWFKEMQYLFSDKAKEFGCEKPKGYLDLGIPGTGKTAFAEAIANKMRLPLIKFDMSKIMSRFVGESEQRAAMAFDIIETCAPCILLIDEVEKALAGTRSSNSSDAGTTSRVFANVLQFLNDNDKGVFTIMTANDVSQLPPELTRAGRLDAIWYHTLPTEEERKEIFKIHFDKANKEISNELLTYASRESINFTGAEIQQAVKATVRKAFKRMIDEKLDTTVITEDDIKLGIKEVIPIYESSKEKIMALENWAKGRAQFTSESSDDYNYNQDKELRLRLRDLD